MSLLWHQAVLCIALPAFGCRADAARKSEPRPATPALPAHAATQVLDAASAPDVQSQSVAATQLRVHPSTPKAYDAPPWPDAATTVKLTWEIHTTAEKVVRLPSGFETVDARNPLWLVVKVGSVSRRIELAPEHGALLPSSQSFCHRAKHAGSSHELTGSDLASVVFSGGGEGGYVVRRGEGPRWSIVKWAESDGAGPTLREETTIATFSAPSARAVDQDVVIASGPGRRESLACSCDGGYCDAPSLVVPMHPR